MTADSPTVVVHRKPAPLCHNSGVDCTCGGKFVPSGLDTLRNFVPVRTTALLCRRLIGTFDFRMSKPHVCCCGSGPDLGYDSDDPFFGENWNKNKF